MNEFINVKPLWACIQNVLPQVYDDTISYQELLYKVISKLNELVENNNKLPDYIADLIREYISSGEIEKVLAEVLATYMLNVKFPPAGLEPASGDGSKDDTEAIQGCIYYAQSHGGMAVYFPSGSYLCDSLNIAGKCTMFGYDRYNTRIVLKGGATRPLLNGSVDEFSLNGLGFDGNMDIQVNNVNLIDITVGSGIITNVFVTDGYDLIKAQVDVDLQISDVVFNHAVENGLVVNGSGRVVVDNSVFRTVSALIGKHYVKFGVSNSVISNCVMVGSCPVGVEITGNMNHVQFDKGECVKGFVDSGTGNNVFVNGVEKSEKLTGDVVENVSGDVRVTVQGDITSTVAGSVSDSSMNKTDSVTGKRTVKSGTVDDSTTGARVVKSGSVNDTVTNDRIVKSDSVNDTVTNGRIVVSGSVNDSTTGDRDINSNNVHNNVDNDVVSVVGGNVTSSAKNYTLECTNAVTVNGNDVVINPTNPLTYNKTPADINKYFKSVPLKNQSGNYNVIVESDFTKFIGSKPYINVAEYGAKGDGVTDDTNAIKSAIASLQNGGCIWFNKGVYIVTEPIVVSEYVDLVLDGFATLKAGSDVNIVELKPNSSISGGIIDVTFNGYSKSAIYLDGVYQFGWTEEPAKCYIENVQIIGHYSGNGILFDARVSTSRSFIQGVVVNNVKLNMLGVGVKLNASKGGSTDTNPTWCNGNVFNNLWIEGCRQCVVLTGGYIPNECSGNIFKSVIIQPYAYYTTSVFECSGSLNIFDTFVWDWQNRQVTAFIITGERNVITSNLPKTNTQAFVDRGHLNIFNSFDGYNCLLPNGTRTRIMCGDQDDFLFKADKRFTVTANNVTNIGNAFNRNGGSYASIAAGQHTSIIIDLKNDYLLDCQFIGVMFSYDGIASNITIEAYYNGVYHTLVNVSQFKEQYLYVPVSEVSKIEYLRISLWNDENEVHLSRIFAQNTNKSGVTFLEDYGSTYHGDLHFDKGNGVTLTDETSGTYYRLYVDGGALKIKQI